MIDNAAFLDLREGVNRVRLLSKPHRYYGHSNLKLQDTPNYSQKVICGTGLESMQCKFCDIPNVKKRSARFLMMLIDRTSNSVKVLDCSGKTFMSIRRFAVDPDWGDPIKYDIGLYLEIERGYNQAKQKVWAISYPPSPLSEADRTIKESMDTTILSEATKQERYKAILDKPYQFINWQENWTGGSVD